MEFLAEFLFDLLLEGSIELLGSQKVPVFFRFLAGLIVGGVYAAMLTLGVMLLRNGLCSQDWALTAVGLGVTALFVVFGILLVRRFRKRSRKDA